MANPIDIGSKIYKVLEQLFGKAFARNMIGTQANVVKPKAMDSNAPTGNIYSKKMLENNPGSLSLAEEKIREYAPSILANKNVMEQMNFLENAENVLNIKKKETGSIMKDPTKTKTAKEADVVDITTGKKVEGIEQLKDELGLPEEVTPKTKMGRNLQELKRLTKETELQEKDIDKTVDKGLENIFRTFMQQPSKDMVMEGKRRAVIRKILLSDERITLPKEVRTSLENYDDLRGGGTKEMDPLTIFNTYYKRDTDKLETLDSIIDTAKNEVDAAGEFKFLEDGFDLVDDPKPPKPPRDEKAGGGLSYLMGV